jgi:hypothetical protein
MAQHWDHYQGTYGNVLEKVGLGLRRCERADDESRTGGIRRQVRANYDFYSDPERDDDHRESPGCTPRYTGSYEDWLEFWREAGARYADAHAKLVVYNEAQWHAREAAVAAGRLNFVGCEKHLRALQHHLGSMEDWVTYAGQVTIAPTGEIAPYRSA